MNKLNLVLFLSFYLIPLPGFSQVSILVSGQLTDTNGQPLAYVNIGVIGTTTGTVSDEFGNYLLSLKEVKTSDTICFTMIGYESQCFPLATWVENEKYDVLMETKIFTLEQVEVKPVFAKLVEKGCKQERSNRHVNFSIAKIPNQNLGAEIGKKFKIKSNSFLESFRFYIHHNDFDTVTFRINVYHWENGKPGKLLNDQNILHTITNKQTGWIKVNLNHIDLFVEENIMVSLSWISHSEQGSKLQLPMIFPVIGSIHVYRFAAQDKWKKFAHISTPMRLQYSR